MNNISNAIRYVGVNDHQVDLFEGQYPVPNGMSYNSYVILDEKVAVLDTVDIHFTEEWLANLAAVLDGRKPDYLVVHHMEPDHSASIAAFLAAYPETTVVATAKALAMMGDFFEGLDLTGRSLPAANGGTLELGAHTLNFVFAPMVHWPEVMFSYESSEKVLFSADAFGKFGALDAPETDWVPEARRYYIGIVGKYGVQVQAVLKKAAGLDIAVICPLHGPVLRGDLSLYLEKYTAWATYQPEEEGVLIAYTSVYGHTRAAAELLAKTLAEKNCKNVVLCDLARTPVSAAVGDAFRYSKLVLATTTYNAGIFPYMREFIDHLTERCFQNRTVGLIENGAWAPMAAKVMREKLAAAKDLTWLETTATIRGGLNEASRAQIAAMAEELAR